MRSTSRLFGVALLSAAFAGACARLPELSNSDDGNTSGASGGKSGEDPGPGINFGGDGGETSKPNDYYQFVSIRVTPEDDVLRVAPGTAGTLDFRVLGKLADGKEVDITKRSVFYVPTGFLIGQFPPDGDNTLTTLVPGGTITTPQRGGKLDVLAQAANADGNILEATTTLTVVVDGTIIPDDSSPLGAPAIPSNPESHFEGTADPAYAPVLVYPNDGALLPPNLGTLEIHFKPGNAGNSLYRVRLAGPVLDLDYFVRCDEEPSLLVAGSCFLAISGDEFDYVALSNQGLGKVSIEVAGSDENGHFGTSDTTNVEFAAERVDGAVYYWSATGSGEIVRFDFGSGLGTPETYLTKDSIPGNSNCIGCHALSRDGKKLFLGMGNSGVGRLAYASDLTKDVGDADFFTYNGATVSENRILLGSFSPSADEFVAVAPKNDSEDDKKLFFHDGVTGTRAADITLPFVPSHPDWSPDGDSIAVTNISGTNSSTIEFMAGGISVVKKIDGAWDAAAPVSVVPPTAGKSRYAPSFVPDGSLLLYSEVDQASYSGTSADACTNSAHSRFCNGYSDPGAKTWAVAPTAGATPVFLAKAASGGIADTLFSPPQTNVSATDLMDTFPKATPFVTKHGDKTLLWFTVSSQRRIGLRKQVTNASVVGDPATQATLWMFALDRDAVLAGSDGSYAGFFLPFQNLATSNHMAQWTERIADAPEPPPPPSPPPPPPPPVPITK